MTIPDDVRALLERPNIVHLSTLRKDGWERVLRFVHAPALDIKST